MAIVCPRCVAFNVSALWHVRRCGDAARQTPWRCAVSALPRSRAPALSVCVACAACWPFGGGRSLRCRVLGALGQSGCCGRAGPCGRAGACWECWACVYGHRLWACVLGVHVAACGLGGLCWASVLGMRAGPFALGPLVMGLRDGPRARPLFRALVLGLRSRPLLWALVPGFSSGNACVGRRAGPLRWVGHVLRVWVCGVWVCLRSPPPPLGVLVGWLGGWVAGWCAFQRVCLLLGSNVTQRR